MTAGTPSSSRPSTSLARLSMLCLNCPGIDSILIGASSRSSTKRGMIRSSVETLVSATILDSPGLRSLRILLIIISLQPK
ncbi:MAG: hypothetical protein A4E51_00207 [Methanosaeta sp. PtaU1.Bin055]|nr:MAG: hypothetical protein A4E51_00207 [Methanosaeta sp. PtaU1.Bin055]